MQTESHDPINAECTIYLIPRSHRRKFFIQFTVMTALGWVVGGVVSIVFDKLVTDKLLSTFTPQLLNLWSNWGSYASLGLFAVIFAADQAIILRKYVSGWLWILTTSCGWLIATQVSTAWINYISSLAESLQRNLLPKEILIIGIVCTGAYIVSGVWMGFTQWIVIRRYTIEAWWWNFLPSIAFFVISLLVWLLSLAYDLFPTIYRDQILGYGEQGLTALTLGIVPAIALCRLKTKGKPTTT
ncbi:hypothetical protein [Calothrix sp. PCC 6303]|uniref:hypothetical protein n=1 Tax=Calothrix sp. PCC 6303 TaxID=1170562 RepID=UPI0002A03244|nr:hypothetical protein [Calothrix sp. PCC 6303]AFZ02977.1 hypothetical protein Cal6303_4061 [Calothrix sp. PCC 6303]